MFGIGPLELVVIAIVAVLLFGPDRLPEFARTAGIRQRDAQAPVQEGQFPESFRQHGERALHGLEDAGVGPEGEGGPTAGCGTHGGGRSYGDAAPVFLNPPGTFVPHLRRQVARQGVGDAGPDADQVRCGNVAACRAYPGVHASQ